MNDMTPEQEQQDAAAICLCLFEVAPFRHAEARKAAHGLPEGKYTVRYAPFSRRFIFVPDAGDRKFVRDDTDGGAE